MENSVLQNIVQVFLRSYFMPKYIGGIKRYENSWFFFSCYLVQLREFLVDRGRIVDMLQ